jgi:hypothetical protein
MTTATIDPTTTRAAPTAVTRARRSTTRTRGMRTPVALLLLAGLFAIALLAPLPTTENAARTQVLAQVEERFPGWRVARVVASWEGAWTVVATCGDQHIGFQMVPGHGLRPGDAWIHPEDAYSWARVESVSDNRTHLVWYGDAHHVSALSCQRELARLEAERRRGGNLLD